MTISIVVFNYNYRRFLEQLFGSLNLAYNNPSFNIFFCDDGSSDSSIEFVHSYIKEFNIQNLSVLPVTAAGNHRKYPSHGQIEGLRMLIKEFPSSLNDYLYFLDSDDYFDKDTLSLILKESLLKKDLYFNNLIDVRDYRVKSHNIREIKRSVLDVSSKIWPTVVPTSGLMISKSFLLKYADRLLTLDSRFADVWLDSRVNMLALNIRDNIKYTDIVVYRLIHGDNDSLKDGIRRTLRKQIQASRFFSYIVDIKLGFSLRKFILELIDG